MVSKGLLDFIRTKTDFSFTSQYLVNNMKCNCRFDTTTTTKPKIICLYLQYFNRENNFNSINIYYNYS